VDGFNEKFNRSFNRQIDQSIKINSRVTFNIFPIPKQLYIEMNWVQAPMMHHSRDGFASISDGVNIYVFGGSFKPSAEVYHIESKNWSLLPQMNQPRSACSCALMGKHEIYVVGG